MQDTLLTVSAAEEFAAEHGERVPGRTIRKAARNGHIPNAQRFAAGWIFTDRDFLYYLNNRPKPGPKPE